MAKFKYREQIDEFKTVSEQGEFYNLIVYQEYVDDNVKGYKKIETEDGIDCNFISENEYEILNLRVKVKKI
jgi:hypothetical protein